MSEYKDFPGGSAVTYLPAMQETHETLVKSLGCEDPLERGMAPNSSILVWRISWTEEPGGLYSLQGHKELDMAETTEHTHTPRT